MILKYHKAVVGTFLMVKDYFYMPERAKYIALKKEK